MSDDTRPDMATRAAELGLTLRTRYDGTHTDPDGWTHDLWRVTLRRGDDKLRTAYRMGMGHNGRRPEIPEVLSSLVSDASHADEPFTDWCEEYGYDSDSRRAEKTWRACRKVRDKLIRLVGSDALETLTYDTEGDE